jgi:hypothetical protein
LRTRSFTALLLPSLLLALAGGVPAAAAGIQPTSCADVLAQNPGAGDGTYTLFLQHLPTSIYCADMAGTPKEYISLAHTGGNYNYSFSPGAHVVYNTRNYLIYGNDALTNYRRIRIDPTTLVVDQKDVTFADRTSVGANGYDPQNPNFKPTPVTADYAVASDCYNLYSARGRANVNLTGTDWAIDDSVTFAVGGWAQSGTVSMDPGRQVVSMTGGGWCGGAGPTGPLKLKLLVQDATAPVTAADVPTGWQNQAVTVTLTATDDATGVASTYWQLDGAPAQEGTNAVISAEGTHSLAYWSVDNAGNAETHQSATVQIDLTAPVVTYTGNAGSYGVDQSVSITCAATDNLSGVASDTCAQVSGPAYSFQLGENTYAASATDNAGNTGTTPGSFTVSVSEAGLCSLTKQFVTKGGVAASLCAKLNNAAKTAAAGDTVASNNLLQAYVNEVAAQAGKALTAAQAEILTQLAGALVK